ncbi:MAG: thiamine ABC transporter substrate-binding protein, partial [Spirochaetales bacterium]
MKRTLPVFLVLLMIPLPLFGRGGAEQSSSGTETAGALEVYCYDSFASEWGPGPAIAAAFEEQTGIQVNLHAPGDAVTVLNQLIVEKDRPVADIVIGLDNSLLTRALDAGILQKYKSPELKTVPQELVFDTSFHMLPYDYGHFAVCYDSGVLKTPPESLEELTGPEYKNSLVLMDPRTSSPGLGFLLWTAAVYGEQWQNYWKRLQPSILTITDSWSQAYTMFTAGEAPLVLSYGTSPVYHAEYEKSTRYRAAEFSEGHIMQIEGMGVVSGAKHPEAARAFIDFMLQAESQNTLAMSNIMLPVNSTVSLPPSFDFAL